FPGAGPRQHLPRLLAPESLGVVLGPVPEDLIFLDAGDMRRTRKLRRRREYPGLLQDAGYRTALVLEGHVRTLHGRKMWRRRPKEVLKQIRVCRPKVKRVLPGAGAE